MELSRAFIPEARRLLTLARNDRHAAERPFEERDNCVIVATSALELGIDVGGLMACIIVGYPGTRASFFQQSGRTGRKDQGSVVFLIGLDTSVNQYIMSEPGYVFEKSIEQAVIDPFNPFVVTGHVRCATHEMPLSERETVMFGPYTDMVLRVLAENMKLKKIFPMTTTTLPHFFFNLEIQL